MRTAVLIAALIAAVACSRARGAPVDCTALESYSEQRACLRAAAEATWPALCRKRGDLRVGLDYEGVRKSCWGTLKPSRVNTTITAGHKHEQWVYGNSYVYFTDGIVTSYQQSSR